MLPSSTLNAREPIALGRIFVAQREVLHDLQPVGEDDVARRSLPTPSAGAVSAIELLVLKAASPLSTPNLSFIGRVRDACFRAFAIASME